ANQEQHVLARMAAEIGPNPGVPRDRPGGVLRACRSEAEDQPCPGGAFGRTGCIVTARITTWVVHRSFALSIFSISAGAGKGGAPRGCRTWYWLPAILPSRPIRKKDGESQTKKRLAVALLRSSIASGKLRSRSLQMAA